MLIGIDASRATVKQRTGTEVYSVHVIRELLRQGQGHTFRLYTNGAPDDGLFEELSLKHPEWGHGPAAGHAGRQRSGQVQPLHEQRRAFPQERRESKDAAPAEVRSAEVRSIPFPRLWTHARLSAEMLARPPDVLFVPAHVLPLVHPRASVVTIHDLGYLSHPESHEPAARRYLDWSTRWNAHQAAAVLADSRATKADLVRAYGARAAKIHVVYLGRDESLKLVTNPLRLAAIRAKYDLAQRYLLYVGTLQPRKNLGRVVQAFGCIAARPELAGVQLVLAGKKGWLYDSLFEQVAHEGLSDRVIFPGYIPEDDLAALLSAATAFIFPSLYEGFGIPVLEAGGCGLPVITSNTSSLPEVAGDAALLVDPHDVDAIAEAMYRIVTDPALAAELRRRGHENVKRFSWEKCARETLAVLESVARVKET